MAAPPSKMRTGSAPRAPRDVAVASFSVQRKGERDFINGPSKFMNENQVLVAFDEGAVLTYELLPDVVRQMTKRQEELAATKHESTRRGMTAPTSIATKGRNYVIQVMKLAMEKANCDLFTFATRSVSSGLFGSRTQYIVTPVLESLERSIDDEEMTTGPDGAEIKLRDAIKASGGCSSTTP